MAFDAITCEKIGAYVYALVDPRDNQPFYIGRGHCNRVFDHINCALSEELESDKYDRIREITPERVKHVILRHGMKDSEAIEVEAALIDYSRFMHFPITNIAAGYHSSSIGYMSADEVMQKYNAPALDYLDPGCVLININRSYQRASSSDAVYRATKEAWRIAAYRIPSLNTVIAEYRGYVIGVFTNLKWYKVPAFDKKGKPITRWGFDGEIAEPDIRNKYMNRSVSKKRGSQSVIRYNL